MFYKISILAFSFFLISANAFGMGADHPKGDLPKYDGWSASLYEALNVPCRVHGFWINSSDTLFYQGGNTVLENMLEKIHDDRKIDVQIILYPGPGIAKSPWTKDVKVSADWAVTVSGKQAIEPQPDRVTFDVWLSSNVSLKELRIPANIKVLAAADIKSDPIDSFIKNRMPKTKD